ncbi:MAG: sulfatase [Armatimonadota bacterium]|nr:MAG: sulfatase [Armatimonadota bacterium]
MKRLWLVICLAVLAIAALALWLSRAASQSSPERFIIIVVDSLRADHVGSYGSEKGLTPNIDAFAATATQFDNAYSAAPYTFASNAALLTGKYPHEVRGRSPGRVADEAITLAEYFRAAGYATAAFSAHFIITRECNFQQGFEAFMHADRQDDAMLKRCCNWLSRHKGDRYFVFMYLWDPHLPYRSKDITPELKAKFDSVRPRARNGDPPLGLDIRRPKITPHPSSDKECSRLEVEVLHELYDGAIRQADRRVGRILREIEDDAGTVVAVVSDHGEEWLDHDGLRHMLTLYRELLHVPCIVRVPGEAPRKVATPMSNIDLTPTLLRLAGITVPTGLRGRPVIGDFEARPIFSECGYIRSFSIHRYGVRMGDETLIYSVKDLLAEPPIPEAGVWERYDLARDPDQRKPLPIDADSELHRTLRDYCEETQDRLEPYRRIQMQSLSKDLLEKLRALGYTAE